MHGLFEVFLFQVRDEAFGQYTELPQLCCVIAEASDTKSNYANVC